MSTLSDSWMFFKKWIRAPKQIAVPIPSSTYLAKSLSQLAGQKQEGIIVELGAGTGIVTRYLLEVGIAPERLVVVEKDPHLAELLRQRYPHVCILETDASHIKAALMEAGVTQIAAIVSSLPMLIIDKQVQLHLLTQCFELLDAQGEFIQYTYGPASPIAGSLLASIGLAGEKCKTIWLNLPPARIWRYWYELPSPVATQLEVVSHGQ